MKILILPAWYNDKNPFSGSFIREQALTLGAAGCEVTIVEVYYIRRPPFRREVEYVKLSGNVTVVRFSFQILVPVRLTQIFYKIARAAKTRRLLNWIKSTGQEFDLVNLQSSMHPLMPWFAYQISRKLGIPMVLTEHYTSFDEAYTARDFYTPDELKHTIVPHASIRFSPTATAARLHQQFFESEFEPLAPIASAIYEDTPLPEARPDPAQVFSFLCIGNLHLRKGHDILLEAFAGKFAGNAQVRLVLAGKVNENEGWRQRIQALGITDQVELLGAVPPQDLIGVLDRSHVLVSASRMETFGIVVLEGMLRGLPIVTTASGGPENFVNASCGVVCPVGQAPELAKALEEVRQNYGRYDRIAIRQYALDHYSRRHFSEVFLQKTEAVS